MKGFNWFKLFFKLIEKKEAELNIKFDKEEIEKGRINLKLSHVQYKRNKKIFKEEQFTEITKEQFTEEVEKWIKPLIEEKKFKRS